MAESKTLGDGFKSRKLLFALGIILLATVMLVMTFITAPVWENVIMTLGVAYMAGNIGEKWTQAR